MFYECALILPSSTEQSIQAPAFFAYVLRKDHRMTDELSKAGKLLSGKEGERFAEVDSATLRKSKLTRHTKGATAGSAATEKAVATKCDDTANHDEFYSDVLARFGIQI
jgi:hypothetical protein